MLNAYPPLRHALNRIKRRRIPLSTIEQKLFSFLKIILILIAISFLISIIFWIFEEEGINVKPFETVGIEENSDGKSFAILLTFDLERIKKIYSESDTSEFSRSKNVNKTIPRPLKDLLIPSSYNLEIIPLDYSISQIGTLGAGGTSVSIGNIALCVKELIGNKVNTITCSLQRYNSTVTAVAILKYRTNTDTEIMTFQAASKISNEEQIPDIINDLAFQISLALSKRGVLSEKGHIFPQNWQTYKYVTQSRDAYNSYMITKDPSDLDKGYNMALSAKKFEPGYSGTYELLSGLGFAYLQKRNYREAESIFLNNTDFKPFESAFGLGMVYYNQNNYPEALKTFREAIQLNPQDALAWNNEGVILNQMQRCVEAVEAFENATRLDPQNAEAWNNKGNALACLGLQEKNNRSYEEAIEAYSRAIEIKSQDSTLSAAAWNGKANVFNSLSKFNESIQACEKAIEIDPQYAMAWLTKGLALHNLRKYDEAVKAYDMAIRLDPNYSESWNKKGITLYNQGKHEEAIVAYDVAIRLDPNLPQAWIGKHLALEKIGKISEANAAKAKAKELLQ